MRGVDHAVGEALASRVRTLSDTPLAVITAGRQDNFPRAPARLARNLRRLWERMHDELAGLSDNSVHVIALRSNHDVPSPHRCQPSIVISAAQAVVRAAREHTRLPQCVVNTCSVTPTFAAAASRATAERWPSIRIASRRPGRHEYRFRL